MRDFPSLLTIALTGLQYVNSELQLEKLKLLQRSDPIWEVLKETQTRETETWKTRQI